MKLALIGCGKAAERHLKIYQALKDEVEVVAVSDLNPERVKIFSEALSAKPYTDFQEMLKREPVDVVDLAVPSGLHKKVGEIILKNFVSIFWWKNLLLLLLKMQKFW